MQPYGRIKNKAYDNWSGYKNPKRPRKYNKIITLPVEDVLPLSPENEVDYHFLFERYARLRQIS